MGLIYARFRPRLTLRIRMAVKQVWAYMCYIWLKIWNFRWKWSLEIFYPKLRKILKYSDLYVFGFIFSEFSVLFFDVARIYSKNFSRWVFGWESGFWRIMMRDLCGGGVGASLSRLGPSIISEFLRNPFDLLLETCKLLLSPILDIIKL